MRCFTKYFINRNKFAINRFEKLIYFMWKLLSRYYKVKSSLLILSWQQLFQRNLQTNTWYNRERNYAGEYRKHIPLTQCLSFVGVGKPSPLNTWPRWDPHLVQTISILRPSESGSSVIAPDTPFAMELERRWNKFDKIAQVTRITNLVECWPAASTVKFRNCSVQICPASYALINSFFRIFRSKLMLQFVL